MEFNVYKPTPLAELRRIVWKRKFLMLAVFVLVVVSGGIATFLITPKYEAQMSILVTRRRVDPQISPSDKNSEIMLNAISDEEFNSELELLKNSEVLSGAARELNLANNQAPKQDSKISRLRESMKRYFSRGGDGQSGAPNEFEAEKIANHIGDNLDVEPVKKSRIIKVSYIDTDPVRAKQTLEAIYQKYIELHVRMSEKAPVTSVFDDQTTDYNAKLKRSTEALKNFDRSNNVTGVEVKSQSDILLRQYYETQKQADQTRTEIDETEKRIAELRKSIDAQPVQIQTGSVSKYVGALDGMKNELIGLNQEKTRLLQKYKPGTRFVTEIEDRIKNLEAALARETANPPQEKSFALNDLRRRLESDLSSAQVGLVALRTRERELIGQAERQRTEAARLNIKSIEREQLERDRKVNEEAYLLYQKKARESEVGEVLNKQQVLNVGIADPPRTDGEIKSPKPLLNLLVLLNLGALAGLASAVIVEKLSPAGRKDYYAVEMPHIDERRNVPLLPREVKRLPSRREARNGYANTATADSQTFTDHDEDEKLAEIANYFRRRDYNEGS